MYSAYTVFFQFLKRLITGNRKVPMLKHEHIRNQPTRISEKKPKKNLRKKFHAELDILKF